MLTINSVQLEINDVTQKHYLNFSGSLDLDPWFCASGFKPNDQLDEVTAAAITKELLTQINFLTTLTKPNDWRT